MKHFLLLLLFAATTSVHAQTEKDIIGKWDYESMEKYEGDADERELMESLLAGFSLQLDANHTGAITVMNTPIVGEWKYDPANKLLILVGGNGKDNSFKILKASASGLTISQKDVYTLNLTRGEPEVLAPPVVPLTKPITKAQLTGKWDLVEFRMSGQAVPASQMGGGFMKFDANGDFSSQIMGMDEQGKWEIVENKGAHQVKTSIKTKTTFFHLIDCTDSQLILAIPGKDGTLVFNKVKS